MHECSKCHVYRKCAFSAENGQWVCIGCQDDGVCEVCDGDEGRHLVGCPRAA